MPFDGTPRPGTAQECRLAYEMLVRLEEFFDGGRKWLKGELRNGHGKYCLLGAMNQLPRHDLMLTYLVRVARGRHAHCPFGTTVVALMNDSCRDFEELRSCLIEARALAAADLRKSSNT